MSTHLLDLSIEVLHHIHLHLHMLNIVNLWFTGTTLLRTKMANGGVSKLEVQFGSGLRPFKWPSLQVLLWQ